MATSVRSRTKYSKLQQEQEDDDDDLQRYMVEDEEVARVEIPYQSIALAILLLALGILFIVFAWLHFTQRILGQQQAEIGFTILGVLTFIPGFYHCVIAYCAWRRYDGFSFDQIPQW